MQSSTLKPAAKPAYAKLEGKFQNKDQTVHQFVRYIDALPATLGRSREPRSQEQGGSYFHVGDSKTISREAVRITFDRENTCFLLEVTGKSSVLVDGKPYTKDDSPAMLHNMSAIKIGQGSSQGMSRFYFLLPLDKPKINLGNLFVLIAKELHRAGKTMLSGRALACAVKNKFPFYGTNKEFATLPRRAVNFMAKSKLFEKRGMKGRSNLFEYVGEEKAQSGNKDPESSMASSDVNNKRAAHPDQKSGSGESEGRIEEGESEPAKRRRID